MYSRWAFFGLLIVPLLLPHGISAQEFVPDTQTTMRARVISVLSEEERLIPGTETYTTYQQIEVEILNGEEKGKVVKIDNDFLALKVGEVFYLTHTIGAFDGRDIYMVSEPYRLTGLYILAGLFLGLLLIFGGIQGIRGLAALIGSLLIIFFILLPQLLAGTSPILLSIGVSSLIVVLGSYVTHGFTKTTTSAVVGMVVTLILTGALAYYAVDMTRLTGFASDESVHLNIGTAGKLDFEGLLLGGILIGLLGVLYDAAIGQAVSVEELTRANPTLSRRKVFERATRIGREHIGALVNTLAIAYVGAALPLLMLFYATQSATAEVINREIFSAEIVRTLIGSSGLVLAVPITTLVAVFMLVKHTPKQDQS